LHEETEREFIMHYRVNIFLLGTLSSH